MPTTATWLAFVITTVGFSLLPGPNVAFLLARSLQRGPAAAWRSALGVEASNIVFAILTAVGMAQLIAASATAFLVLKWAGICYLCWLGLQALRQTSGRAGDSSDQSVERWWAQLGRGFLSGISNPKVAVFFVAFLPQFVRSGAAAGPQLVLLGITFALVGLVVDTFWCVAAGLITRRFRNRPVAWRNLGRASALSYFGLAGWAALSSHRPAPRP